MPMAASRHVERHGTRGARLVLAVDRRRRWQLPRVQACPFHRPIRSRERNRVVLVHIREGCARGAALRIQAGSWLVLALAIAGHDPKERWNVGIAIRASHEAVRWKGDSEEGRLRIQNGPPTPGKLGRRRSPSPRARSASRWARPGARSCRRSRCR
jgi:hypothetical protein